MSQKLIFMEEKPVSFYKGLTPEKIFEEKALLLRNKVINILNRKYSLGFYVDGEGPYTLENLDLDFITFRLLNTTKSGNKLSFLYGFNSSYVLEGFIPQGDEEKYVSKKHELFGMIPLSYKRSINGLYFPTIPTLRVPIIHLQTTDTENFKDSVLYSRIKRRL